MGRMKSWGKKMLTDVILNVLIYNSCVIITYFYLEIFRNQLKIKGKQRWNVWGICFTLIGLFFLEDLHCPFAHLWKSSSINCILVVLPWSFKLFVRQSQNYSFKEKSVLLPTFWGLQRCLNILSFQFDTPTNTVSPLFCLDYGIYWER